VSNLLGRRHSERINALVCDIIENSWAATGETGIPRSEIRIGMSDKVASAANTLREFMFQRVYLWEGRREESEQAKRVISVLYNHFIQHPEGMHTDFGVASDPLWRRVADFVCGMTDQFALATAERLGAPLH
ncbi:MAG: deoxyguanosinetriphosphate triphosphohydrolase, partial [Chloroflexi bacterium]